MYILIRLIALVTAAGVSLVQPALGQSRDVGLIRDTEIENIISDYATPIFNAAGLDANSVTIHLVNDARLNAFVAGGQRMFVNTGLLMRAETPEQVIGVIAHEAGHIAGGHLTRLQDQLRNAETKSILAMIVGTAAGLATGDGRVAGAIISGGTQAAFSDLLKYSRTQESAADSAGLKYLDSTQTSARGLREFFELLQREIRVTGGREHPYLSSHPLTNDRITTVESHLAFSRFSNTPTPPDLARKHALMRAKLFGFMEPLSSTLTRYGEQDLSTPARYARAIAFYRRSNLDRAIPLIDELIIDEPNNPYYLELKGQMLLENGQVVASLVPYGLMAKLAPDKPLLRSALAKAQVESGDPGQLEDALSNLLAATRSDPTLLESWRLLTVVYGRLGLQGELVLSQAEYSLLGGDSDAAEALGKRALDLLPLGSPGSIRAQDIVSEAGRRLEKK
ncbi:MAG: M48 family metalloprotease [Woeseiaceae bacterium]|nr:M48 family metalloprotease [Woeseiaceae bacterium]